MHLRLATLGIAICLLVSSCADGGKPDAVASIGKQVVVLSPAVEAGWAGWCVGVRDAVLSGSCPNVRSHGPILAERWGRRVGGGVIDVAVTSSEVSAVSLSNGTVLPTRAERGLPGGLRAVVAEIKTGNNQSLESTISHGFVPLNTKQEQIIKSGEQLGSLGYEVQGEGWQGQGEQAHGVCALSAAGTDHIRAIRGGVVDRKPPYPGLIGDAFVTCASTEYSLGAQKTMLLAGVLIDASTPASPPGSLPEMTSVSGHQGIYKAPVENGYVVAKRLAGAWLFVANGPFTHKDTSLPQRLTLLEHLYATVHLYY